MAPSTPARANQKALLLIFFLCFLDLLGASLLVPVAPYLVRQYRADATAVAVLNLSYSAAQFLAAPVLGVLSDRFGRRPVLLLSLLGSAVGYFVFGWAGSLSLLYFSRVLDGISGGNISTAQAYIADVSAPQDRAKNFGLIGAAFGLGFILGPAAGGLLAKISLQTPAFVAGGLSLVTLTLAWFFLPESLPPAKRADQGLRWSTLNPIGQVAKALRRPELRTLLICSFVLNFAFSGLQTNFAVYTIARFGLTTGQNAALFSWLGILLAVMQGVLARRLLKQDQEGRWALISILILSAGFVAVAAVPTAGWLYAAITVTAAGGLANPALTGLLSRRVAVQEQGFALGVVQSLNSLTRVLGPMYAGFVFDHVDPTAPYWSGAVWILISAGFAAVALRQRHAIVASEARNP